MAAPAPMPRSRPIQRGSERTMLESMLDFHRATVVKHLAGTERFWFSIDFAGLDVSRPWTDEDLHGCFRIESGDTLAAIVTDYVEECEQEPARHCGHLDLLREATDGSVGM